MFSLTRAGLIRANRNRDPPIDVRFGDRHAAVVGTFHRKLARTAQLLWNEMSAPSIAKLLLVPLRIGRIIGDGGVRWAVGVVSLLA